MHKTFLHDGLVATIQNISREGVQIKTRESLLVGNSVKMAFTTNGAIVRPVGLVVYAHSLAGADLLAGLRFVELSNRDSVLLVHFVDSRSNKVTEQMKERRGNDKAFWRRMASQKTNPFDRR